MASKHTRNKFFGRLGDRVTIRLTDDLKEELFQFAEKNDLLDFKFVNDLVVPFMRSKNGVESLEIEKPLDEDYFPCNKLCKKARQCTSQAFEHLGEIKVDNCYRSRYPYKWTTPDGRTVRLCKFMVFARGFVDDEENPYPRCVAKQKDVPIQLPKDRIMRDPELCWICYKDRKKAREQKLAKKVFRDEYRGQPRVNWDASNPY